MTKFGPAGLPATRISGIRKPRYGANKITLRLIRARGLAEADQRTPFCDIICILINAREGLQKFRTLYLSKRPLLSMSVLRGGACLSTPADVKGLLLAATDCRRVCEDCPRSRFASIIPIRGEAKQENATHSPSPDSMASQ